MKIDEMKELVALLEASTLNMLEISEGDSRIRLEKASPIFGLPTPNIPIAQSVINPGATNISSIVGACGKETGVTETSVDVSESHSLGKAVKSPMVGVFYSAPAPGENSFVEIGSRVEKGDVLCIIEAMKLMNEIVAETGGEIVEICCEDGGVVEYGQPLFYIR